MTQTQTLEDFTQENNIRISVEMVGENPYNPDWTDAYHYRCTLTRRDRGNRKQMTVYFSMGYAHTDEPDTESVLNALALDSSSIENASNFEDWASEYGYDTDSRKAERIYQAVEKQAEKLRKFLGADLYEELLWETESL